DDAYFARKVQHAVQYRRDVMSEDDFLCCRMVHGEADGLPGLTVDRYGSILVAEAASYGIDLRREVIYEALKESIGGIEGIYERNEGDLRLKEGLDQYKGWYGLQHPEKTNVQIVENGLIFDVDFENGQKTGYFLDQKYNRAVVGRLARGRRVLDCCTHTGSFALNAAANGAASVTAMDISETALAEARRNAELNGLQVTFRQGGDVFEELRRLKAEHQTFDLIILDPPAFTKSRRTIAYARNGYRNINAMALSLLPRGGYLATNSCSHFMSTQLFTEMLRDASHDVSCSLRIVESCSASPDHPVLIDVPETSYLKFFLVQKV
ncbi:MAG: class I SAM-dependent rRNA methyltransferase, partial [Solobacterium sp.]|nr:class I SAM-dependent rRNA methyltransferase [Solobacterium sp.]